MKEKIPHPEGRVISNLRRAAKIAILEAHFSLADFMYQAKDAYAYIEQDWIDNLGTKEDNEDIRRSS